MDQGAGACDPPFFLSDIKRTGETMATKRMSGLLLAGAMVLALGACQKAAPPAAVVDPAVEAATTKWAALAKLPDWSGVWEIDWRNTRGAPPRPQMKLTPKYQAELDA